MTERPVVGRLGPIHRAERTSRAVFVGHYGISFVAKRGDPALRLWVLFLAVQLLDIAWAPFVLIGIEKVRIAPGITRSNPLDLYYMPFTHSLLAAVLWSLGAAALYRLLTRRARGGSATLIGLAVFSHWILDFVDHRPDLPLYDDVAKVGLGLSNLPAIAFGVEALLLLGGIVLCTQAGFVRKPAGLIFGLAMLGIHAYGFFGPPPVSVRDVAVTSLVAYAVFAGVIYLLERPLGVGAQPA